MGKGKGIYRKKKNKSSCVCVPVCMCTHLCVCVCVERGHICRDGGRAGLAHVEDLLVPESTDL